MSEVSLSLPTSEVGDTTTRRKSAPILDVRGLTVAYNGAPAIEDVDFCVQPGERVAIIGPNGAGKSTLIKAIVGLLQPRSGSIQVKEGCRLGYVPQHEGVNWDFPVTVRDVAAMGRIPHTRRQRWPWRDQRQAVDTALARVGLAELAGRQVGELSGGQRRRVFIARALAMEAAVLLLDEPFSGVDAGAQEDLLAVLDSLNRDGLTVIISTHDLGLAFRRFDRVLALRQRIIACGPASEVYTPEVLTQLYGGRLAVLDAGQHVTVFVDDHVCEQEE